MSFSNAPTFPPLDAEFTGQQIDASYGEQMLYSMESETAVLGALLMDNGCWDLLSDKLTQHHFYRHEHQLIWQAISSLITSGKTADVITVFEKLKDSKKAEQVGGLQYLNQLAQYLPSSANILRYSDIVAEKAIKRKLQSAAEAIIRDVQHADMPIEQLLDKAESGINNISEQTSTNAQGFKSTQELALEFMNILEERLDNPQEVVGISTGLDDLDKMTSGLMDGDLIVLAARPSMGKTALAINIAEAVAIEQRLPVAIFSLEMGADQLVTRIISSRSRVNQMAIKQGRVSGDDLSKVTEAVETLLASPISINDQGSVTMAQIRSESRKLKRQLKEKLSLIVVDYLQLINTSADTSGRSGDNRATELGDISRGLKQLAKEIGCPIIALSQLNRSVEQRSDKRPMMSDLRESGAIEQDADIIMFIYRDDYYNKDSKEPNVAEIIIGKQRNGPTGTVKTYFEKNYSRFANLSMGSGSDY